MPACFRVDPDDAEAWQLQVGQPQDVVISVRAPGPAGDFDIDAFEFGLETVTLAGGHSYTFEVRLVKPGGEFVVQAAVTKLEPRGAESWSAAERIGSAAKRSRQLADAADALARWERTADASAIARTHLLIGDLELRAGNAIAARSAYESARTNCLARNDVRCIAEASNNSGLMALRLGNMDAAQALLTEASARWKNLKETVNQGRTLSNLGLLAWRTGEYQKAIGHYFEARQLLRHEPASLARLLNNLGLTYLSVYEFARARAIFSAAAKEHQRLTPPGPTAYLFSNLGWAHLREGRFDQAEPALQRALRQAEAEKDRFARAAVLVNLGHALRGLGRFEQSRARLEEGLLAARAVADRQVEGSALSQFGSLAASGGAHSEARNYFRRAIEAYRACGQRDLEFDATVSLAELELEAGDSGLARQLANGAQPLVESLRAGSGTPALRASYFARKRSVFDLLIKIAAGNGQVAESFLLGERARARALLDLLAGGPLELAPKPLASERAAIQRRLNFLSSRLRQAGEEAAGMRNQFQIALAESDAVEARIREAVTPQRLGAPLADIGEVKVPAGSALLAFHLAEGRSFLWLVEPGRPPRLFHLPGREELEGRVLRATGLFNAILERRRFPATHRRFETEWSQLCAALLRPLRGIVLPRRLLFALDGSLHRLPLAALKRPGYPQPLGLTHELLRVPSAAFLARRGQFRPDLRRPVLALADPVFSSRDARVKAKPALPEAGLSLARLPFTAEIDVMRSALPPSGMELLRGFAANAVDLERRSLTRYSLLHLSTHTLIDDEEPEASHIALSLVDETGGSIGGLLYPRRLARWRLHDAVVVLSSCDTASGKLVPGEGLAGFTNVLLMAGAAQLVLTTSRVDAEATAEFFRHFYEHYFSSGHLERSLAAAMRALATSRRWSDAGYWAPFAALGAPSASGSEGL